MRYIIYTTLLITFIISCSKSDFTPIENNNTNDNDSIYLNLDSLGITLDSLGNYVDSLGNTVLIDSLGIISIVDSVSFGCTNPLACNFDEQADSDDGTCILPDGCTDELALNYNPQANCDDGSCDYLFVVCEEVNGFFNIEPNCPEYEIPLIGETINIEERFDDEVYVQCEDNVINIEFGDNSLLNAVMQDSDGNFIIESQEIVFDFTENSNSPEDFGFLPVDVSGYGEFNLDSYGNINSITVWVTFTFELLPGVSDSTNCELIFVPQ